MAESLGSGMKDWPSPEDLVDVRRAQWTEEEVW